MDIHAYNSSLANSKILKAQKLLTKLDSDYIPVEPYLRSPTDLLDLSMNDISREISILVKRLDQLEKGLSTMKEILS